ncbi:hypothetical protein F5Y09DRAFT_350585 [Xylaria sp. FL1042]|nr:hypothetical protein F5Y09DRAFT_350585 [Xylaria sp. FL1042]
MFFGTPHQGGNHVALGNIAVSIARVTLHNPTNTFLEALKKDSLFADELVQDFRQQLEDYYVDGTGKWFLESPKYGHWLQNDGQTLFCHGIPGGGKTVLTSVVIKQLHPRQDTTKSGGSVDSRDRGNILGCGNFRKRCFIIIDALDEGPSLEGRRMQFIKQMKEFQKKTRANILMIASSILDIMEVFIECPTLEIRAREDDEQMFLDKEILDLELRRLLKGGTDLQEVIKNKICETADGMFLIASLLLNLLDGTTDKSEIHDDGRVPLVWAVLGGHTAIVQLLLGSGRVDIGLGDRDGLTALWHAKSKGYEGIALVLLAAGAVYEY